ncbi:MAG: hypothetical protein ACI4SG_07885 [Oligosphaeraceae bacterium]
MKRSFVFTLVAAIAAVMCGCQNLQPKKPLAPVITSRTVSPAAVEEAPTTRAHGPVNSYRPLYAVDSTQILSAKVTGISSKEGAEKAAISKFLLDNQCEDIFVVKKIVTSWSNDRYDGEVFGYPVTVVGVDEIKTGIYEQAPDGSLKPMEKLEHKLVYKQPYVKTVDKVLTVKGEDGKTIVQEKVPVPGRWEYTPFGE